MSDQLCACGCGQPTNIATKTDKRYGHVKGQPMKYLPGHFKPTAPVSEYRDIMVGDIEVKPQVRKAFDEAALQELAQSIREHGVIQPLIVRPLEPAGFELVAGERRLRASKLAGLGWVPCRVMTLTDQQAAKLQLLENLQRRDLDPIEEAEGYDRLIREHGARAVDLAKELGVSEALISNRRRLLRLPESVRGEISRGNLAAATALVLVKWEDAPELVDAIAAELVERKVSQADAPRFVDRVVLADRPCVGGDSSWQLKTLDQEAHKDCPCRRMVSNGYGGMCAVCINQDRFEQVEGEVRGRLDEEARAEVAARTDGKGDKKTAGLIDVEKLGGSSWGRDATHRIVGRECKADHGACPCLRNALSYGKKCKICIDPKAFDKLERAEAKERTKAHREELKTAASEFSQWAQERAEYTSGAMPGSIELAYFAALVICSVDPDYSGPGGKPRASVQDYLRSVGVDWSGQIFSYQHAPIAEKLRTVPDDILWRICIEWPLLAEAPDSQRSLGHWYRRTVDGPDAPEPAAAEA